MPVFIDSVKAQKVTAKVLDDMETCDTIDLGRVHILKVWGGWIYYSFEAAKAVTAVFVPQTRPRVDRIDESQQPES